MLRRMLTIRRFEERASNDYLAGKIYGVMHWYIGEEAVAIGVCTALDRARPDQLDASRSRLLHRPGRFPAQDTPGNPQRGMLSAPSADGSGTAAAGMMSAAAPRAMTRWRNPSVIRS
jgi:hypothetical protein